MITEKCNQKVNKLNDETNHNNPTDLIKHPFNQLCQFCPSKVIIMRGILATVLSFQGTQGKLQLNPLQYQGK